LPFALPPYNILILSELGMSLFNLFLSQSNTYLVCYGVDEIPVPIAQTG
jgi:hypothetical protein